MQHNDVYKGTEFFALTKESNEKELKLYFNAVLKLAESDNEFPINLDEVYPLVYERKDSAVKALKEKFLGRCRLPAAPPKSGAGFRC